MKRQLSALVVDDDDIIRGISSEFLLKMGIEVESAKDGVEALKIFTEKSFDLVLTDVQMPYMDGVTLACEIKKIVPKTVIIMMSGNMQVDEQTKRFADFFVAKPFGLGEMFRLINCVLEADGTPVGTKTNLREKKEEIMNKKSVQWTLLMVMILVFAAATTVQADEIIFKSDLQNMVVSEETVGKTADNVVVMVDTSESMAAMNKTHKKSYYELEKEALKTGFERLPDLGYNVGVYRFTPWEVIYPMQKFNAAAAEDALNKLPAQAAGKTPLVPGLNELGTVLQGLSGKTYVYIFSDGGYDRTASTTSPGDITTELAKKYDVCFQVVNYAFQERDVKTVSDMARANMCSRSIPFDSYVDQPYYAISPLYYVKEHKYSAKPILFGVDKYDLSPAAKEELDGIGKFLVGQPKSFVVLSGYTDDTGKPEYNMELSRRRAEAAADYLDKNYNLKSDRVVANWYGAANPVDSNDTTEGRAQNRRVELGIGEM